MVYSRHKRRRPAGGTDLGRDAGSRAGHEWLLCSRLECLARVSTPPCFDCLNCYLCRAFDRWNNVRYALETTLLHARLLDRTAVLPSFVYARSCEYPYPVAPFNDTNGKVIAMGDGGVFHMGSGPTGACGGWFKEVVKGVVMGTSLFSAHSPTLSMTHIFVCIHRL